jgi:hypothetical protein
MKEKLEHLIVCAKGLKNSSFGSPEFNAWRTDVLRFLEKHYGKESTEVTSFNSPPFLSIASLFGISDATRADDEERFQQDLKTAILYLRNYLSDFDDGPKEEQR